MGTHCQKGDDILVQVYLKEGGQGRYCHCERKKLHDKRYDIARRDQERELARESRERK